jgi:hypothetical protein
MLNTTRHYTLPPEVAGTPLVGGATVIDVLRAQLVPSYYAHIRAGTVEHVPDPAWQRPTVADPEWEGDAPQIPDESAEAPLVDSFVPVRVLGQALERELSIRDVAAFRQSVKDNPEYGASVPDGHPSETVGIMLMWMLNEWASEMMAT